MPTFRFTHRDDNGSIVFGAEKVKSWDSIKIGLTRNDTFRGLLRKYTGTMEFVKDVRRRIIRNVDKNGSEAQMYLTIEQGNDNKDRSSFSLLGDSEMKADMTTLEITELEAKINYKGSGFEEVLMNRIDNESEYNTHKSVDGDTIPTFTDETVKIELHDRVLELNSALNGGFNVDGKADPLTIQSATNSDFFVPLPFTINYASDTDFKNVMPQPYAISDLNNAETFVILQAEESKTVNIKFNIDTIIELLLARAPGVNFSGEIYFYRRIVDKDYNKVSDTAIETFNYTSNSTSFIPFHVTYKADVQIFLEKGQSVQFYLDINLPHGSTYNSYGVSVKKASENKDAIVSNSKSYSEKTTANCIYPYELFSRYLSIYTGVQLPFYSKIFGRVELGYDVDGEWSRLVALNGKMIRDFPFADCKFSTSLKDIFKAYNCILNLGATIETTLSGEKRLRVDRFEDLLSSKIVLRLGDLTTGVSRSLNKKYLWSEIIVGYKDQEYEALNGLGTFNGLTNLTTPLKSISTKLDLTCPFRTDDYGLEQIRRIQYKNTPKEDASGDDDIWLIDAYVDGGKLKARKTELFETVEGILNPSSVYNLRLSPGRNLRRWGNVVHSCMPNGGVIKFGAGPKNTNLVTKLLTETKPITEKADVNVSDLEPALFTPETLTIGECPFNKEQWLSLQQNPGGIVEFENKGVKLYGYIEEMEYEAAKKLANFELIRINR